MYVFTCPGSKLLSVKRDGRIILIVIFYHYKRNIKRTECASYSDLYINKC